MIFFNYFNDVQSNNEEQEVAPKEAARFTRSDQIQSSAAQVVASALKEQEYYIEELNRALLKATCSSAEDDGTVASASIGAKPELTKSSSFSDSVSSLGSTKSVGSSSSSCARVSSLQDQLEKVEKSYADLHCLAFELWTTGRRTANDNSASKSSSSSWTIADKSVATHVVEVIMEELDGRIQHDEKLVKNGFSSTAQATAVKAHAELGCLAAKIWRSQECFHYRSEIAHILLSTAEQKLN